MGRKRGCFYGYLHHRTSLLWFFAVGSRLVRPGRQEVFVFFVQCPRCKAVVEIPAEAIGPGRTDPWNVVGCEECDCTFDFDDEDLQHTGDATETH